MTCKCSTTIPLNIIHNDPAAPTVELMLPPTPTMLADGSLVTINAVPSAEPVRVQVTNPSGSDQPVGLLLWAHVADGSPFSGDFSGETWNVTVDGVSSTAFTLTSGAGHATFHVDQSGTLFNGTQQVRAEDTVACGSFSFTAKGPLFPIFVTATPKSKIAQGATLSFNVTQAARGGSTAFHITLDEARHEGDPTFTIRTVPTVDPCPCP